MRAINTLTKPVMAGIDIGNGYVKAVTNLQREPIVFQSTASPATSVGEQLMGGNLPDPVLIDDKPWLVGLPPRMMRHEQAIHKGACLSDEHYALFLEAIDRIGCDIDLLMVGMTCDQIGDRAKTRTLKDKLVGLHQIRPDRTVFIDRVGVKSQPVGTARLYLESIIDDVTDQTFLVIDIGEGTTDITKVDVAIDDDDNLMVNADQAGTMSEWLAMRSVCERLADRLGGKPGDISRKLRAGGLHDEAAEEAAPIAIDLATAIKTRLRSLDGIDMILLTGGGAHILGLAMAERFDGKPVKMMPESSLANARGFLLLAQDHAG